jgi:hypothetical protein
LAVRDAIDTNFHDPSGAVREDMADDVDGRADEQCDRGALGLRHRDTAVPAVRKRM